MPKKYDNIPLVTDLVAAGDPRLKVDTNTLNQQNSYFDELNTRIDELEDAIGQDNSGPIGRAFAIRAEKSAAFNQPESLQPHHNNTRKRNQKDKEVL